MWMTLCLVSLVWVSTTQAGGRESPNLKHKGTPVPTTLSSVSDSTPARGETQNTKVPPNFCENVLSGCQGSNVSWTRCYDDRIRKCRQGRLIMKNFIKRRVNSSQEVVESPTLEHGVYIPSSALQIIRGADPEEEVQLVITVLNSTYFKGAMGPGPPVHRQGTVMGESVLVVNAGNFPVRNLPQPIKLIFKHNKEVENGTCVFWEELGDGTGHWSKVSDTKDNGTHFICSCYHLSFFAVLVFQRALASEDVRNVVNLGYITYTGPALSVFFTANSLIIYICL